MRSMFANVDRIRDVESICGRPEKVCGAGLTCLPSWVDFGYRRCNNSWLSCRTFVVCSACRRFSLPVRKSPELAMTLNAENAAARASDFLNTIPVYPDGFDGRGIVICAGGVKY